jgi:hypothetical protein
MREQSQPRLDADVDKGSLDPKRTVFVNDRLKRNPVMVVFGPLAPRAVDDVKAFDESRACAFI